MKKVLLVSPYPYTQSSRGMDVLTESFEKLNWETHHLQFPNVFYSVKKHTQFPTQVIEHKSRSLIVPYIDSIMKHWPNVFFRLISRAHRKSAASINFSNFDVVVLESGKPLFLLESIPPTVEIIYRQSDPVQLFLGSNPAYTAFENQVFRRASKILIVKNRFKETIPEEHRYKTSLIENGFSVPNVPPERKTLLDKLDGLNAVYFGLTPLDVSALKYICYKNPKVTFHLFGTGVPLYHRLAIQRIKNCINHRFQPIEVIFHYLSKADLFIYPYQKTERTRFLGVTSKLLLAMYCEKPIISFTTDAQSDFSELPIHFSENAEDFSDMVSKVLENQKSVQYNIDWKKFGQAARVAEYQNFIKGL